MEHQTDALSLLLGRVEGKVDTLITMQSSFTSRVDGLEERVSKGEVAIATLQSSVETAKTTNQNHFSNITAIVATIIAAISAYLSYKT